MATVQIKINLTDHQKSKLRAAHNKKRGVTIRLKNEQLTLMGKDTINVTPLQFKKIMSAKTSKAKRGVELSFTHAQIGGFLGALLAAVAPTLIQGVANLVQKKPFFGQGMRPNKKKEGTACFFQEQNNYAETATGVEGYSGSTTPLELRHR